ncbi:MAG: hypothetical protein KDA37_18920 [Planctomycetales bacterium]|nr:hypothetical protein [Planctomycetales bacterium]
MAITDADTVLVLGAGTSAPFGLPLGGVLIDKIRERIRSEIAHALGRDFTSRLQEASVSYAAFYRMPFYGAVGSRHIKWNGNSGQIMQSVNADLERIQNLEKLLANQTSETIDDFIVENPDYADLAKIGIAVEFMMGCYDFDDYRHAVKPFSSRITSPQNGLEIRNWIHLLINVIRQGIRSGNVSAENKIRVITFNYDTILEHVLSEQFSNSQLMQGKNYQDFVEIVHVHGQCGELNEQIASPQKRCVSWAQGIHVVNEPDVPGEILQARQTAREWVEQAGEIYLCGFAFARPNLRLLGLEQPQLHRRRLFVHNYDGNVGLNRTAKTLESEWVSVEINEATPDRPMQICDWIRTGYLGEIG